MQRRGMTLIFTGCVALLLTGAADAPPPPLEVTPGVPVAGVINGQPVQMLVQASGLNRLVLAPETVARLGLKPAGLFGNVSVKLAGRSVYKGHNRPLRFAVAGAATEARVFWLEGLAPGGPEATIGPWGLPQPRVRFRLPGAAEGAEHYRFPLLGDVNSQALTSGKLGGQIFGLAFRVDGPGRLPLATAAMGALLAEQFQGRVSGASWDEEIVLGIKRPVRLLTLARPLEIGPFRLTRFAVRVPDRIDDSGRGTAIPEAGEEDPSEVVVTGKTAGKPAYGLTLPASALNACVSLSFDKPGKQIELVCRPPVVD